MTKQLQKMNDELDNLPTNEDFKNFIIQGLKDRIISNPESFADSLKESNVIDDKQYKQIMMNIRKDKLETDFTNDI